MSTHIPTGFAPITPYFLLEDPDAFVAFAKAGLGATERMLHRDDDGRVVHAELDVFGSVIELGQPRAEFPKSRMALHVFVPDPDAAYARALAAGAKSLYEVQGHEYGERSGGVEDAFGNQWYFAAVTDAAKRSV